MEEVQAFTEKVPFHIYLLNIFYCLLPAFLIYLGILVGFPVEMTLFIHFVIELIIPKIIISQFKDSYLFRIEWRANRFEGSLIMGLVLGFIFCGLTILLYYFFDKILGWDLEDNLLREPIPQNKILEIIAAFYLIVIKPFIEEWFWRSYCYFIFYRTEIDNWLNSVLWATAYVVLAIMCGLEMKGCIIVFIAFTLFGRIQLFMMKSYGLLVAVMSHMGASFGVMLCYFLEKNRKFGE
ncbi:unnamed protein product [Moneuplotes crassus]|uniref:CAAX prenyl protease 2/Lysostaphin resistance protein A-like domain-containing protein n=1 Tax=Euplotes crassus TaxID=5936 RepID=A0AAD1XV21_EUPCR|nr:unnamed protein product [Moneuplotes crassus]